MHPVTEAVFDLAAGRRTRHNRGRAEHSRLSYAETTPHGLAYVAVQDDHPEALTLQAHVLPKLGLQVVKFEYREPRRHHASFDYYIDIARVTEQGKRWVVRDLYLDVLVFDGNKAEILDTDEYLAAIQEGHLGADEAAYALETAHTLLNKLAQHEYTLESYLQTEGVTLTWRKLKSTL